MGRITTPALVLWGALDVVLPVSQADDALDALGSVQKTKVVFARSAHNAFDEEPEAFADAVKPFVESVRAP